MSGSSGSTVSATTVNGVSRFSGLGSGVDVDSLVQKMISADSGTLNQLKQQEQMDKWKQEQFRTIITDIKSFADKYLDLASPDSVLAQSNFQKFAVASDNAAVSATAGGTAEPTNHIITVNRLATAASQASGSGITKEVTGLAAPNYDALAGKSFTMKVDGTVRTVTFDKEYGSVKPQDGVKYVQAAIDAAIGTTTDSKGGRISKVTVSLDGGSQLVFAPTLDSGVGSIAISDAAVKGAFGCLGFSGSANLSNRLNTADTLEVVAAKLKTGFAFDATAGEIEFTVNGKKFSFDKADTLSDMIHTINQDEAANAIMKYDQNTDQLLITAKSTGAGRTLALADTAGSFVSKLLTVSTAGQDAQVVLDGQRLTRSSNDVIQDGVTYTLHKTTTGTATVNVTQDVDGICTQINNFVGAYNKLIKEINDKLSENYDRNYPPLTEDQQKAMSETEIKNWNQKAMTGLLERDSGLQNMVKDMRSALMSSVAGQANMLAKLGITTETYKEKGQLHINKSKLRQAVSEDPQVVMNFFALQSKDYPGTTTVRTLSGSQRTVRTKEEGLAYKLYDIIQDNIGTIRDMNGNKGVLLQRAGMSGDASDTANMLTKDMETLAKKITAEQKRLNDEEERYYAQFTNMETALAKISSQSAMLTSLMNSK
jgi:flagellar hook-associated protein 2